MENLRLRYVLLGSLSKKNKIGDFPFNSNDQVIK